MSADKLREYREIFSFFDRDGGGSIGAEEFEAVMRTFGWNPKADWSTVKVRDEVRGLQYAADASSLMP